VRSSAVGSSPTDSKDTDLTLFGDLAEMTPAGTGTACLAFPAGDSAAERGPQAASMKTPPTTHTDKPETFRISGAEPNTRFAARPAASYARGVMQSYAPLICAKRVSAVLAVLGCMLVTGYAAADSGDGGVVDPWSPDSRDPASATAKAAWEAPVVPDLVEPWAPGALRVSETPEVLDPWSEPGTRIPTRAFPPIGVVDPWLGAASGEARAR
jgi:hypothetical protein